MTIQQTRTKWGRTKFGTGRTSAMAIALPCGLVLGAVGGWLSVLVGITESNPIVGFLVFTLCLTMPALALVYALIVDKNTLEGAAEQPDDSIEAKWYDKATSSSFTDLIWVLGAVSIALAFIPTNISVDLKLVLPAVLAVCFTSFAIRYLMLRYKG